ncbi:MAG: PadR family transcriptional regulator [Ktedonobacteraceae bacterium]
MYTDILILSALHRRPQHGYEIKKSLESLFGGFLTLTNSMLYPALQRFEEMGAVQRVVLRQEGKPDRHIYHLTDRGIAIMLDLMRDFPPEVAKREAEFLVRVAFFDLLDPQERLDILKTRQGVLSRRQANIPRMKETLYGMGRLPFVGHVLTFREHQFQLELDWIEALIQEQQRLL